MFSLISHRSRSVQSPPHEAMALARCIELSWERGSSGWTGVGKSERIVGIMDMGEYVCTSCEINDCSAVRCATRTRDQSEKSRQKSVTWCVWASFGTHWHAPHEDARVLSSPRSFVSLTTIIRAFLSIDFHRARRYARCCCAEETPLSGRGRRRRRRAINSCKKRAACHVYHSSQRVDDEQTTPFFFSSSASFSKFFALCHRRTDIEGRPGILGFEPLRGCVFLPSPSNLVTTPTTTNSVQTFLITTYRASSLLLSSGVVKGSSGVCCAHLATCHL